MVRVIARTKNGFTKEIAALDERQVWSRYDGMDVGNECLDLQFTPLSAVKITRAMFEEAVEFLICVSK